MHDYIHMCTSISISIHVSYLYVFIQPRNAMVYGINDDQEELLVNVALDRKAEKTHTVLYVHVYIYLYLYVYLYIYICIFISI
jgi:hypothetical protein